MCGHAMEVFSKPWAPHCTVSPIETQTDKLESGIVHVNLGGAYAYTYLECVRNIFVLEMALKWSIQFYVNIQISSCPKEMSALYTHVGTCGLYGRLVHLLKV